MSASMASSAPTAACPAWRDPARWHTTTDVVAVLIALSLPWSTSLVGIFGVVLLIAIAPTVELRAFWTLLKRPICVAPIALFCLALVGTLCAAFGRAGVPAEAIGVLTPYRQQVRHLRAAVPAGVEVLTVDQAQGRDWPLVLVSMVRSNDARQAGSLLRDTRRINVLLTRAKHKLLLVGSARTLAGRDADAARPLARVLAQLHATSAVVAVPADALDGVCADTRATATHTSPSKARAIKTARTARGVVAEVLAEHGLGELGI